MQALLLLEEGDEIAMPDITGVILCGGKGERLKPFTDHRPKPLLPLNGRPLLYYLLQYLSRSGVNRFVLCTGYKAECIEEFVRQECDTSWDIRCVNSGDVTMTQRMLDAWPYVREQALVCYGDTLANVNLTGLQRRHAKRNSAVTMALYRLRSPFGIVKFDRQKHARSFLEKPMLPYWINIGFLLCNKNATQHYLETSPDMVEFLSKLAEERSLSVYEHSGKHLTVNTDKERQQAESEMVEFLSILDS